MKRYKLLFKSKDGETFRLVFVHAKNDDDVARAARAKLDKSPIKKLFQVWEKCGCMFEPAPKRGKL